jgi:4-oxalocrotonate tautomerase
MPILEITLIEGRDKEAKKRLVEKVTDAVVESIAAPRESVRIILREVPAEHFVVGGVMKEPIKTPSK